MCFQLFIMTGILISDSDGARTQNETATEYDTLVKDMVCPANYQGTDQTTIHNQVYHAALGQVINQLHEWKDERLNGDK
jgi:hypothetical protein